MQSLVHARSWIVSPFRLLLAAAALAAVLVPGARAQGTPIGFVEDFALATDRAAVLGRLAPGTPEFYWFHCLNAQHTGDLDAVPPLLATWIERHGRDARTQAIEHRQVLLAYERDPEGAYEYLVRTLGLSFDRRAEIPGADPALPTRLDQALIDERTLVQRALDWHTDALGGFRDTFLDELVAGAGGNAAHQGPRLVELLARLDRADLPGVEALVLKELRQRTSRGFGPLGVHRALSLAQLEALAATEKSLLSNAAWVEAVLVRLQPNADVDVASDAGARLTYLENLETFAERLPAVHNSLKAHVAYHRLAHDLARGVVDQQRLTRYLSYPRIAPWTSQRQRESFNQTRETVDLSAALPTGMPPIGNDEPLVRACLAHVFEDAPNFEEWTLLVDREYLERLFAETKLLSGMGDSEQWYSLVDDAAWYAALEKRVDLAFPPTQPTHFAADELVRVALDVKNVDTLIVKVYAIDALSWCTANGREVPTDVPLDGLVATSESTYRYDEPALIAQRREFEFPELAGAGTWVLEFIGNGSASRVLVKKGSLAATERVGASGHVFQVFNETGALQTSARILFAGREYTTDAFGEIAVPFSTDPGTRTLVLASGRRVAATTFEHQAERCELAAGFFVERETLASGGRAPLLVRPRLFTNDAPASLALLENVVLRVDATDHSGVATSLEVRNPALTTDGEFVLEIAVPQRLARLQAVLSGTVKSAIGGPDMAVSAQSTVFELARIEGTDWTAVPLLGRSSKGFHVDVLGRNGEPLAAAPYTITFDHTDFTDRTAVLLQTDANGRIELGALATVSHVTVSGPQGEFGRWSLADARSTIPTELRGVVGEELRVPYRAALVGNASVDGATGGAPTRDGFSLVRVHGGAVVADEFDHIALEPGAVVLRGLPPGEHRLRLFDQPQTVRVRIVDGERRGVAAVSRTRLVETGPGRSLTLQSIDTSGAYVVITTAGGSSDTRVHVVATRWLPMHDMAALLDIGSVDGRSSVDLVQPLSQFLAQRDIGDEFRYVLERRLAKRFPGVMLTRPSLLLNPWDIGEVSPNVEEQLEMGESIGGGAGAIGLRAGGRRSRSEGGDGANPGVWADLDFVAKGAVVIANLRPDANGVVRVLKSSLAGNQHVHVVAVDDTSLVSRSIALDELSFSRVDQRLARALDPTVPHGEKRSMLVIAAGQPARVEDRRATYETFASLADVYALFTTLAPSPDLARFEFLTRWPSLTDEERRTKYSEHACHELHLFLHEHDRAFFDAVVRPYLAQKLHPTFLDDWLLERDLAVYLEPRAFARLNVVERILLGRRLESARPGLVRLVEEQLALIPPEVLDRAEFGTFSLALATGGLDASRLSESLGQLGYVDMNGFGGDGAPGAPPATLGVPGDPRGGGGEPAMSKELADQFFGDAPTEDARHDDKLSDALKSRRQNADLERRRGQSGGFFRAVDPTRAFAESNYWKRRIAEHEAGLVTVDRFWLDFARTPQGEPFVSHHFAAAADSLNEVLLALALLDLPFEPQELVVVSEGLSDVITSDTPFVLAVRDVAPLERAEGALPVLVSQDFFRLAEPMRHDGVRFVDAFVEDEFLVNEPYGCRVVVTNPTSSPRELELLLQIPAGSIGVRGTLATRGAPVALAPYGTTTVEYAFYFPAAGSFEHAPVVVAEDEKAVAVAPADRFEVRVEPTRIDTTSWEYVSQRGTTDEVFEHLARTNVQSLDLSRIAWRCSDAAFFARLLTELRARFVFDATLWSYGFVHRDAVAVNEYLRHADWFVAQCGAWLDTPLLAIDPIERHAYEHIEYTPLVNARAHQLPGRREVLNRDVAAQYLALLDVLAYKPALDAADWAQVTYHLLLQDRVADALEAFSRVDRAQLGTDVQLDYLAAYLDFFTDERRLARGLAERHIDHPVARWRELFREIVAQLDEAEGRTRPDTGDALTNSDLASNAPVLELAVTGTQFTLTHANLTSVEVGYYPMDVELLFSADPFLGSDTSTGAWVEPRRRDTLALRQGSRTTGFDLPSEFARANLLVEVRAGGIVRRTAVFASALDVQWIENFGELRVAHAETGRALAKVYVKVFARDPDGSVRFHKDGYTDLRGRFDYASLSGEGATSAQRYAVLVLSDEFGAKVNDLAPPTR
jgi:hypothetical protein